jgi:hypothetical protein
VFSSIECPTAASPPIDEYPFACDRWDSELRLAQPRQAYAATARRQSLMKNEWTPDDQPWARLAGAAEPGGGTESTGYLRCLFCGSKSAKRSYDDSPKDTGRIELYCTNENCEAREITVLVMKDTYQAHTRADVRLLAALDRGQTDIPAPHDPPPITTFADLMRRPDVDLTARRQDDGDVIAAAASSGPPISPSVYQNNTE